MSERVLHEWTDALGDKFRMIDGPRPAGIGFQTSTAETGWEWKPTVLTTIDAGKALLGLLCETRRLSAIFDREKTLRKRDTARVSELEQQNARLRKCVEAADRIDGFAVAGSVLLEQRGHKRDADEAMEYVKAYRAARAEVDNG